MGVLGGAERRVRAGLRLAAVASFVLVLVGLGLELRLTHHLNRVDGVFGPLGDRPAEGPGTTLLLLGTRSGTTAPGPTVRWLPGTPGLESVMLVHLAPDRRTAVVESLELDPALVVGVTSAQPHHTVAAVERVTGRRVDHLVAFDWVVLQRLAPDGTDARYLAGSPVAAQHQFLHGMLEDALPTGTGPPLWTLDEALDTLTRGMTVEAEWSLLELSLLLLSLRDLRSADIEFRVLRAPPSRSPILANAIAAPAARPTGR